MRLKLLEFSFFSFCKKMYNSKNLNSNSNSSFSICQFNCFAFGPRSEQVREFLLENDIDFLAMNEMKVSEEKFNMLFQSFKARFNCAVKFRMKNSDAGGGAGLIFKKQILFTELRCFDHLCLELVAVEAVTSIGKVAVVSYYNPPSKTFSRELCLELEKRYKNYILCGDFNAHSTSLGQNKTNTSGRVLEEV